MWREAKIEGTVSFSVIFTEQGKLKDIGVVRSLEITLDHAAIGSAPKLGPVGE